MKLKLEAQGSVAILSVLESIVIQDVLVLKAGLNKLFQSGKKQVVLDLAAITNDNIGDEAARELAQLPAWAIASEAHLAVASPIPGVGQAPDRDGAIKILGSPLGKLLATEAKLAAQLKGLQAKKDKLEQLVSAPVNPESDIRLLKQQGSELRMLARSLEEQIKILLKERKPPLAASADAKRKSVLESIASLLQHQGVIPPK